MGAQMEKYNPNQRYLNQPGNGSENQNEEFRNEYIKGFNDCYGSYNTCYDQGVLDGMTVNENMRTGQFESQVQRYGGCYDQGFHFGCALVKGMQRLVLIICMSRPKTSGNHELIHGRSIVISPIYKIKI